MSQSVSVAEVPPPPTSHRDVPSPSGGGERGRGHWFILGAILLLAAALRFYKIDVQSLWYDEGNSARIAERSVQLIVEGAAGDIHPPLYYLLLKFWRGIFGDSEAGLRSLSALCGVFSVLFSFLIGRNLLGQAGRTRRGFFAGGCAVCRVLLARGAHVCPIGCVRGSIYLGVDKVDRVDRVE